MFVLWSDVHATAHFVTLTKRAKSSLSEHLILQHDTSGEGAVHIYTNNGIRETTSVVAPSWKWPIPVFKSLDIMYT